MAVAIFYLLNEILGTGNDYDNGDDDDENNGNNNNNN
jgi:hypothetical protein